MHAIFSDDQGITFPYETNVDNTGWIVSSCPSSGPHGVFVNNELITTWATGASGNRRVALSVSNVNTGFNLLGTYTNDDPSQNRDYPRISADADTVVLAYKDYYGTQSDVFVSVAFSSSIGDLLTNGILACESPAGIQTNPDIIISNGTVHLCFQDNNSGNVVYRSGSVGDVTKVKELNAQTIILYPNPTSSATFNLNTDMIAEVSIKNSLGQTIPCVVESHQGLTSVEMESENKGVYQVSITLNNGRTVIKKWLIK